MIVENLIRLFSYVFGFGVAFGMGLDLLMLGISKAFGLLHR